MQTLYSLTALNDIGTRLRFLTALQIEKMISGMFPYAVAYPFGSSVNGYGKMGCDLDLVLRLSEKGLVRFCLRDVEFIIDHILLERRWPTNFPLQSTTWFRKDCQSKTDGGFG